MARPRVLLFDLGGVLIRISFARVVEHWARSAGCEPTVFANFTMDAPYRRHERGELSVAEYFAHLADLFGVELTPEQWLAGWNTVFRGEVSGMRELLRKLAPAYRLSLFSNTNQAHHDAWTRDYAELLAPIPVRFTSHELGLRKPDAAAFRAVVAALECAPGDILFFDDTEENVSGARAVGIGARLIDPECAATQVAAAVADWTELARY